MRIKSVCIQNYKSYHEPTTIRLSGGFNCIVGQNDVGKTAILEAIGLQFTDKPHRSLASRPSRSGMKDPLSLAIAEFTLSKAELVQATQSVPYFALPLSSDTSSAARNALTQSFIDNVQAENTFTAWYQSGMFVHGKLNDFEPGTRTHLQVGIRWKSDRFEPSDQYGSSSWDQEFAAVIGSYLRSRIFQFRAERLNAGSSPFGAGNLLKSDASNLPEVLLAIQGNPARARRLNEYLQLIFPHIEHISVRSGNADNSVDIAVWPCGIGERDDLAILLAESGTGISQVLAILAVVLSAEYPQSIIIDEPQSFLHPGAARKLIEVLRGHEEHQFIVATHSPTIVAAANPTTIIGIRKQGHASVLSSISSEARHELEELLNDIGVRLSDVFGADTILWVEGRTEELCYPLVVRERSELSQMGTVILGLSSTGEIEGRHAELVFDLYRRLSSSTALLPPAIGFVLDREMRTEAQREDFKRRSTSPVHFLERRTYENYLIHPGAIAAVLSSSLGEAITPAAITEWLDSHRMDQRWSKNISADRVASGEWITDVDAPKLLESLFVDLSQQRVEYRKTHHSVEITRWLLRYEPDQLSAIAELLAELLRREGAHPERLQAKE